MKLVNASIYSSEMCFEKRDVELLGNRISRLSLFGKPLKDDQTYDLSGCYITPGFIDTHIHGAAGYDTSDCDAKNLKKLSSELTRWGIAGYLPTTMTLPKDKTIDAVNSVYDCFHDGNFTGAGALILGVHLEGPYLNPEYCGVQNPEYSLNPCDDNGLLDVLEKRFPNFVKIVDIAPEMPGAIEFINRNASKHIFSLAHSSCDYDTADLAFKSGATSVTHLMNAMKSCEKRAPGILGAAFDNCDIRCEIICDGQHIDPSFLRMLFKLLGSDRITVVSDAMRASGMPDGKYLLADALVEKKNGRTYYGDLGGLAGSVTNLYMEYGRLLSYGIPICDVIRTMTVNPAITLGIYESDIPMGVIKEGARASLNVFNSENKLIMVITDGIITHDYRNIGGLDYEG